MTDSTPDYKTMDFDGLLRDAEADNVEAQFYLGYAYLRGETVTQDFVQAAIWFRKAAHQTVCNDEHDVLSNAMLDVYNLVAKESQVIQQQVTTILGGRPALANQPKQKPLTILAMFLNC